MNNQHRHPAEMQMQQPMQMPPMGMPMQMGMGMQQPMGMSPMGMGMPMQPMGMPPMGMQPMGMQPMQQQHASVSPDQTGALVQRILEGGLFFQPASAKMINKVMAALDGDELQITAIAALLALGMFDSQVDDTILESYLKTWHDAGEVKLNITRDVQPTGMLNLEQVLELAGGLKAKQTKDLQYSVYIATTIPPGPNNADLVIYSEAIPVDNQDGDTKILLAQKGSVLKLIGLASRIDDIPRQIAGRIRPMIKVLEEALGISLAKMYEQGGLSALKIRDEHSVLQAGFSKMFGDKGFIKVDRIIPNVDVPKLTKGKTYANFFKEPLGDGVYYMGDNVLVVNDCDIAVF